MERGKQPALGPMYYIESHSLGLALLVRCVPASLTPAIVGSHTCPNFEIFESGVDVGGGGGGGAGISRILSGTNRRNDILVHAHAPLWRKIKLTSSYCARPMRALQRPSEHLHKAHMSVRIRIQV